MAAGAGCNFALACDIVVAAHSASFIEVFSCIGLIPDAGGGTYVRPRLVGIARAMALSMLAEPVGAEQAEKRGLIWKCVPDDKLQEVRDALAACLCMAPAKALGLIKKASYSSLHYDFDTQTQLALEANLQRQAGERSDFKNCVSAFFGETRGAFFRTLIVSSLRLDHTNPDDQIYALGHHIFWERRQSRNGHRCGVYIDQLAAFHLVQMIVRSGVRIIENSARIYDNFPHDLLFNE